LRLLLRLAKDGEANSPPQTPTRRQQPSERRSPERRRGERDHRTVPAAQPSKRTGTRAKWLRLIERLAGIGISGEVKRESRIWRHCVLPSVKGRLRPPVEAATRRRRPYLRLAYKL
jgi:hypothetical protein